MKSNSRIEETNMSNIDTDCILVALSLSSNSALLVSVPAQISNHVSHAFTNNNHLPRRKDRPICYNNGSWRIIMFEAKLVSELAQLNRYLDEENLPEILMKVVERVMGADRAIVILSDGAKLSDGQRDLGTQYSSHPLDQMALSRSVIEEAMGSDYHYAVKSEAVNPSESMGLHKIRSCVAAAVHHGNHLIGALYCDNRKSRRDFVAEDGERLATVAGLTAAVLDQLREREVQHGERSVVSVQRDRRSLSSKLSDLIGVSPSIQELRRSVGQVANMSHSVLITGPSGCGKEVVARLLHTESSRTGKFIAMNCAESMESVLASELFGHEKGAFTDATVSRTGLIVAADGGTLFLDEIGNASMDFQAKMLRVIETREVRPIGSNVTTGKVDVRFVFATNKDLEQRVAEKTFMPDLYYRINQIRLSVLPLSTRKEDIVPLAERYAHPKTITSEASSYLMGLDWPGNVRELKQLVEVARDLAQSQEIMLDDVLSASRFSSKMDKVRAAIHAIEVGEMNFYQLRVALDEGRYTPAELERILENVYRSQGESWAAVGRKLGMSTREDSKKFDNFIYNVKKRYNILQNL